MLAIRLQRTGRGGHAQFRVIVQDSRFSPKRGRIVAYLGNYDPHTKAATFDSQKAAEYLEKGAQPSERVARLLQKEGIKLPAWVKLSEPQKRAVRHPEKRRSTRPAGTEAPVTSAAEAAKEELAGTPTEEPPATEETAVENPAAESAAEEQKAAEEPALEEPAAQTETPVEQPAAEEPSPEKAE